MVDVGLVGTMMIVAFAGGALGAAFGALPSFVFTGIMVIAGEAARIAGILSLEGGADLGVMGITAQIAFGAFFGPHIAFAGGAAASAYAAKKDYMIPEFGGGWGYHDGKNILIAFSGRHNDVLIVGGLFGILGYIIFYISSNLAAPWDPIAFGVVVSALAHRLALGYGAIGNVRTDGILDLSGFDREETYETDGTQGQPAERLIVEPWLPWFRSWGAVGLNGLIFGILGGFTYWATGSPYLAFGISAASLIFLNLGIENDFGNFQLKMPVTHHITLPASTAPMAYSGIGLAEAEPALVQAQLSLFEAVLLGAVFGLIGALLGELAERIFYAHGDTHWDPPATSIVATTFLIAILALLGIFPTSGWVPVPV